MKKVLFTVLLVTTMLLCSCGTKKEIKKIENDFASQLPPNKSSVDVKQKVSSYFMVVEEEDNGWLIPSLILYENDKSYVFQYDVLSSYISMGHYTEDSEKIICKDDKYTYIFNKTKDGLKFNEKESSEVKLIDEEMGYKLEEGSLFILPELE